MLYRARRLTGDEIDRMDDKGSDLLKSLDSPFPSHGVRLSSGTFRSVFCGEKPHSIVHSGRNYRVMSRLKTFTTVALAPLAETRPKEAKRKTHKTNNHSTVGMSILQSNMNVEAVLHLLHDNRGCKC